MSARSRYLTTTRFPSLDGLRCFAILPVFWHHATLGPLPGVLGRGPLGVDLFFALSGFLITTLLLREQDATSDISARRFYARRALRIFPLYYGVLALYALYAWLFLPHGAQRDHFFQSLPFFATYTTDWFVDFAVPHPVSFAFSWSLAVEEQFYLLWPWVLMMVRWSRLLPFALCLLLLGTDLGALHGLWLTHLPLGGLSRRMVMSLSAPICMGSFLALVLHSPMGFAIARVVVGARASAAVFFVGLVACVVLDGVPLWLAQLALTLVVGACAIRPDHSLTWIMNGRVVRWIGTVSYGMYLFHVAIITGARRILPLAFTSPGWVFVLVLPATVALASLSYVLFEQPLLRRGPPRATAMRWDTSG